MVGRPIGGDDEFVQRRSDGRRRYLRVGVHTDGRHELGKHRRDRTFGNYRVDLGDRLRLRGRLFVDEGERALRLGGVCCREIACAELVAGAEVVLGVEFGVVVEFVGVIEVRCFVVLVGVVLVGVAVSGGSVVFGGFVVFVVLVVLVVVVVRRLLATPTIVLRRGRRRRRPCALVGMGDA
ncbi:hypothetical protein [Mycolicibacterium monacense]|uniref:hypothetical protein n=1 Tax=Mycolicibacterium monacense TaxID=85693 RepID=UPI001F3614B4|nr:hypothetical protein [Mycolicibacterium monacense]